MATTSFVLESLKQGMLQKCNSYQWSPLRSRYRTSQKATTGPDAENNHDQVGGASQGIHNSCTE